MVWKECKGKIEPLCEELKSKAIKAKKDYETPFGTDKNLLRFFVMERLWLHLPMLTCRPKYPFSILIIRRLKQPLTHLNEGNRWYKPNPP